MKDRIFQIRKAENLTQTEFAEKLGLTKNYISLIENGNRIPGDRTVADICRIFGVNRVWLESGVGDPVVEKDERDELKAIFADVLSGRPTEKNAFIEAVAQLPDEVFPVLVKSWIAAAEEMKRIIAEKE